MKNEIIEGWRVRIVIIIIIINYIINRSVIIIRTYIMEDLVDQRQVVAFTLGEMGNWSRVPTKV